MISEYIFVNCIQGFLEDKDVIHYCTTQRVLIPHLITRKYTSLHTVWNPNRKIMKFKILKSGYMSVENFKALVYKLSKSVNLKYLEIERTQDFVGYCNLRVLPKNLEEMYITSFDMFVPYKSLPFEQNVKLNKLILKELSINYKSEKLLMLPKHLRHLQITSKIYISRNANNLIEIIGNLEILELNCEVSTLIIFILPKTIKNIIYKSGNIMFQIPTDCQDPEIKKYN